MDVQHPTDNTLVFSYLTLRKAIGFLGIGFPFLLYLGERVIFGSGIRSSISSYYYTGMRDVFVGVLFAIGFFLLSYRGYALADEIAGVLACIFAVGVALFPTAPDGAATGVAELIGHVHLGFAALFFGTLIYFSLFLFTKTDPSKPPTRRKLQRNRVYRTCAYVMAACILLTFVYFILPAPIAAFFAMLQPIYWLEAISIVAFGVSWITKGEAILKDQSEVQIRAEPAPDLTI
jgi:hypothetical protein